MAGIGSLGAGQLDWVASWPLEVGWCHSWIIIWSRIQCDIAGYRLGNSARVLKLSPKPLRMKGLLCVSPAPLLEKSWTGRWGRGCLDALPLSLEAGLGAYLEHSSSALSQG